jgi:PIN domain nuclease of toxin-antitoxin system
LDGVRAEENLKAAHEAIRAALSGEPLAVSAVTLYELAVIVARKWIDTPLSPDAFLEDMTERFTLRAVTARISVAAATMPRDYPSDPLDRIIGATALVEGLKLVTAEEKIRKSNAVPVVW